MKRVHAVFTNGAFVPNERCDLPEGTEVELAFTSGQEAPGGIHDSPRISREERRAAIERVIQRMKQTPLSDDAPRFTREELHDRR